MFIFLNKYMLNFCKFCVINASISRSGHFTSKFGLAHVEKHLFLMGETVGNFSINLISVSYNSKTYCYRLMRHIRFKRSYREFLFSFMKRMFNDLAVHSLTVLSVFNSPYKKVLLIWLRNVFYCYLPKFISAFMLY